MMCFEMWISLAGDELFFLTSITIIGIFISVLSGIDMSNVDN